MLARLKAIVIIGLLIVFAVFALQNTAMVSVKFFFWDFAVARALLMFICLAAGCIIGLLSAWGISQKSKKRKAEKIHIS